MKKILTLTLMLLAFACGTAFAQVDPGLYVAMQDGKAVGMVYIAPHAAAQSVYAEHWFLFSACAGKSLELVADSSKQYDTLDEFMRSTTLPLGYRYRYVLVNEGKVVH